MIDLRSLVAERMNKVFRDNIEFLFDRFESQDLCAIVVSSFTFHFCLLVYENNDIVNKYTFVVGRN